MHKAYLEAKAGLEEGLEGVRKALSVLRNYYGSTAAGAAMLQSASSQPEAPELHTNAAGAGTSIIGLLEVVESDFARNLAQEETEEADAQSTYDDMTQTNKVTKTVKDQDVKYKIQEHTSLDQSIAELSADRETKKAQLAAVLDYYAKIKSRCVAKPESYAERAARRAAEIAGLKQALSILEDEAAFTQRKKRAFRGHLLGASA